MFNYSKLRENTVKQKQQMLEENANAKVIRRLKGNVRVSLAHTQKNVFQDFHGFF